MSLFSFASIIFNSALSNKFSGDLLADNKYKYEILKYPSDLGDTDKGHYMVIHINEQKNTAAEYKGTLSGENATVYQNRLNNDTQSTVNLKGLQSVFGESINKGLDTITGYFTGGQVSNLNFNIDTFSKSMARTILRTTDTIALYMPDSLGFSYQQKYDTPSLNGLTPMALAAGSSLSDNAGKYKENALQAFGNLMPFAASYMLRNSSAFANVLASSFFGVVQNPMLEVIYSSPEFRMFRFDFFFYPRSENEATEVQKIIGRLQFHQAPEIEKESKGFFMVPPSEFDIKFYYNGRENPNIPKISTCILESIDLDYAPNGFAAYEVPGESAPSLGRTGMPVAIRMSLQFRETEYLTKANFKKY